MALTYTYPDHLAPFNAPLFTLSETMPGFTNFVVGGLIFSSPPPPPTNINDNPGAGEGEVKPEHRILLLQRSYADSYGGYWEAPSGGLEPTDPSVFAGAAREVLEESGLHVSRFVELVSVDEWTRPWRDGVRVVAKFTFLVEVVEAHAGPHGAGELDGTVHRGLGCTWEDGVKLAKGEHQAYAWVTESELREAVEGSGKYETFGRQGENMLKAFGMLKGAHS